MEKIKIVNIIERRPIASTRNPGTTFNVVKFLDDKNRLLETSGKSGDNFKSGDEIEGDIKQDQYGVKFYPMSAGSKFGPKNLWPDAYRLAMDYVLNREDIKDMSFKYLDHFANQFKSRLENGPPIAKVLNSVESSIPQSTNSFTGPSKSDIEEDINIDNIPF